MIPNFKKVAHFQSISYCMHTQDENALKIATNLGLPSFSKAALNEDIEGTVLVEIHEHSEGGDCLHIHIEFDLVGTDGEVAEGDVEPEELLKMFTPFIGTKVLGRCTCTLNIPDAEIPTSSIIFGMKGISTVIDSHKVRLSGAELTFDPDDKYDLFRWQSRDDLTRVTLGAEFRVTLSEKTLRSRMTSIRKGINNFVFNRK